MDNGDRFFLGSLTALVVVMGLLVFTHYRSPVNQLHQLRPCTDIIRYNDGRLVCEIDIQAEDDTI